MDKGGHAWERASASKWTLLAEFFAHRHSYGKWACAGCQGSVQEVVEPRITDDGKPAAALVAYTLSASGITCRITRATINGRSSVSVAGKPCHSGAGPKASASRSCSNSTGQPLSFPPAYW